MPQIDRLYVWYGHLGQWRDTTPKCRPWRSSESRKGGMRSAIKIYLQPTVLITTIKEILSWEHKGVD